MAHFQADIEGARGPASRLGTRSSGMQAVVRSWQGQVCVSLYARGEVDYARVTIEPHGGGNGIELFDGPVSAWNKQEKVA